MDSLLDQEFSGQEELDQHIVDLDGTRNLGRLGANSILAVSLAFANASASAQKVPLYSYFANMCPEDIVGPIRIPLPTINLFSGGVHAGGQVAIQDVLLVPKPFSDFPTQLEAMSEVYQVAVDYIDSKYGMRNLTADEGGLAPPFASSSAMLDGAMECAQEVGLEAGVDFALAVDAAASHFFEDGLYYIDGASMDTRPAHILV